MSKPIKEIKLPPKASRIDPTQEEALLKALSRLKEQVETESLLESAYLAAKTALEDQRKARVQAKAEVDALIAKAVNK